ncbi:Uncharacterized conserved protein, DUF2252 family [Nocardioides sp. YR527]|uniref:DUF2252 domain-containing protein n=1 Tax=Nocardioides sp. YR527 TaxID=1881028 RepID=UPI0008854938|nr:DUF2252 domain-containing protein [Nocardioides sp. YR527]SDK27172.1 Uncharacterized conserved protein, DUF2252 family [Nocardioides sp. YR527]
MSSIETQAPRPHHLTLAERASVGRGARARVPRSVHGEWRPAPDRADPVGLLEEQGSSRVQELVPLRYGRMLVNPFTFFRGSAYLMAADLAGAPRTDLTVQLCGDAHLSNFGSFAAPDRRLVFGLNDFDETLPGPFEWDVKRMVASFAVAGRDREFDDAARRAVNMAAASSYREAMRELARMRKLDVWYARLDMDELDALMSSQIESKQLKRFRKNVAKAQAKNSLKAFSKLVEIVDGRPRLIHDPPMIARIQELMPDNEFHEVEDTLHAILHIYRGTLQGDHRHLLEGFRFTDAARKVVGVGSVGTRAWIVLLIGNDDQDPLFLQAKEATASVLEPFLGKSAYTSHGQRVVEGQRLMQSASDVMLGWVRASGFDGVERDFFVRQLWDGKGSAIVEAMNPTAMTGYARMCGWTLARAHARSGDPVAIASYLGSGDRFDRAVSAFAEAYADQNERDYAALRRAVDDGRVVAQRG